MGTCHGKHCLGRSLILKAEELVCTSAEWCGVLKYTPSCVFQELAQLEDAESSTCSFLPFMFKLQNISTVHMGKANGSFMPRCKNKPFASKAVEMTFEDVCLDNICEKCSERASSEELDALQSWFE